jgi:hypothetical protein
VLFDLKPVEESNTKKVEDILSFPIGLYLPSSDQRFMFYDNLHDDGFAENCKSGQTAVTRELKSGAVRVEFFPCVGYQKVGQLSQLSIGYLYSLRGLMV